MVKRVIHCSADFDYAENLRFSDGAVRVGTQALKNGCGIVTDTQMARSGINKSTLEKLGAKVHCFMSGEIEIIEGEAPGMLEGLPVPTHAFIGGSSGNISALLEKNKGVRIVVNALTLETLSEKMGCVKEYDFTQYEAVQTAVSRSRRLGAYNMMKALNPVYIIWMQSDE